MKKIATIGLIAAVLVSIIPTAAFARDGEVNADIRAHVKGNLENRIKKFEKRMDKRVEKNSDGVWVGNGTSTGIGMILPALFQKGTVTAVSSTGFTLGRGNNQSALTVNTTNAKIVRVPNTVIALAGIQVGEGVWVMGDMNGNVLNASVVHVISQSIKPAAGRGTVTAVSNGNITLQTKNNSTVTVKTNENTKVVKDGQVVGTGTAAISTGSKIKFFGLWDKALNVYTALKIKIKS